ncbi:hypothetical protein BpHYR1_016581 [Brachionus plicatilis]|uniref:Uncharacterized protein n=1 Tax=Brachionus plicatilis TaxID=10195 RepID=A0A3M7Q3E4_BRAPC|nr:hypothetical protein BpHYR1_016581 [Brachionus plicatilis]
MDNNSNLFRNLFDYNLRSLKIANLNYNKIRTITKRMFSDLLNLEELFLEENEIDQIEDNSFNELKYLFKCFEINLSQNYYAWKLFMTKKTYYNV